VSGVGPTSVCSRCGRLVDGFGAGLCPACARAEASGEGVGPGRLAKRVLAVAATGGVLLAWFSFVPWGAWNRTNGLIFGVIAAFSLMTTWVMTGALIEKEA